MKSSPCTDVEEMGEGGGRDGCQISLIRYFFIFWFVSRLTAVFTKQNKLQVADEIPRACVRAPASDASL